MIGLQPWAGRSPPMIGGGLMDGLQGTPSQ